MTRSLGFSGWVALVALAALASVAGGCSRSSSRTQAVTADAGREARADVKLVTRSEAGETWRAKTVVPKDASWVTVDEEVTFDARGQMVHGFTRVRLDDGVPRSTWYERQTGIVTTEQGETVTRFAPAADAPWVYAPIEGPDGEPIPTPLGAWTTYRAASRQPSVRVIGTKASTLVPADQLVFDTERGTTLAIGDDGVDLDDRFALSVRLRGSRVIFFRNAIADDGSCSFGAITCDGAPSCAAVRPERARGG